MEMAEFLLARIAEDEERATFVQREQAGQWQDPEPWRLSWQDEYDLLCIEPSRALAECKAKRRIVEAESRRRRPRNMVAAEVEFPSDVVTVTWMDDQGYPHRERVSQAKYRERFTEPSPPSDTLKLLALPYADHPDFREEWRP